MVHFHANFHPFSQISRVVRIELSLEVRTNCKCEAEKFLRVVETLVIHSMIVAKFGSSLKILLLYRRYRNERLYVNRNRNSRNP